MFGVCVCVFRSSHVRILEGEFKAVNRIKWVWDYSANKVLHLDVGIPHYSRL